MNSKFTTLSAETLHTVPFPPEVMKIFEEHVRTDNLNNIICKISANNFVVQDKNTHENTPGILHVRIDSKKQLYCTCSKFKRMQSVSGATTAPKISRRCFHIYFCLWGIFSREKLKKEFSFVLFYESHLSGIADSHLAKE